MWDTRLPSSIQDIGKYYVEGSTAILPNLHGPAVIMLHDHAYISLECVADLLGHGLPVDNIINTSEAFDVSQKSVKLLEHKVLSYKQ